MHLFVEEITHIYSNGKQSSLLALDKINFEIRSGELVFVLGPSGCGKSTLLRILAGLLIPSSGKVLINDNPPFQALVQKQIGWMAQSPALLPWHTIYDNIALAQKINPQKDRKLPLPQDLLRLVGLADVAKDYPFMLSGGMQARAALARTLSLGADLWLLDEPFASLDELTRESLADELISIWQHFGPTIIWVTHNIYEAVRLADRIIVMSSRPGRISAILPVSIPRPRGDVDPQFNETIQKIRSITRQNGIGIRSDH